jgi:hypothetical protein
MPSPTASLQAGGGAGCGSRSSGDAGGGVAGLAQRATSSPRVGNLSRHCVAFVSPHGVSAPRRACSLCSEIPGRAARIAGRACWQRSTSAALRPEGGQQPMQNREAAVGIVGPSGSWSVPDRPVERPRGPAGAARTRGIGGSATSRSDRPRCGCSCARNSARLMQFPINQPVADPPYVDHEARRARVGELLAQPGGVGVERPSRPEGLKAPDAA